jgi:hypothetical protein
MSRAVAAAARRVGARLRANGTEAFPHIHSPASGLLHEHSHARAKPCKGSTIPRCSQRHPLVTNPESRIPNPGSQA